MNAQPVDALAVVDDAADMLDMLRHSRHAADLREARAAVADALDALKAWNRWDYEIGSATVNGASVYSYEELFDMRVEARKKADAALARVGGAA